MGDIPPDIVIRRLPIYARCLRYLLDEGILSVSSNVLGKRANVTAAQIRKDLSYFGEFGKQGIGYDAKKLLTQIEHILGLTQQWAMVLVGVGHLGQAILHYEGFHTRGVCIAGAFDNDPNRIGQHIAGLCVLPNDQLARVVQEKNAKVGIVAVPAPHAQEVTDMLVAAGVRAILNYAPIVLHVPEDVYVRSIDPVAFLHSMTYYLAQTEEKKGNESI